jgi:hypothetical protein
MRALMHNAANLMFRAKLRCCARAQGDRFAGQSRKLRLSQLWMKRFQICQRFIYSVSDYGVVGGERWMKAVGGVRGRGTRW